MSIDKWLWMIVGAAIMYVVSGMIVTASFVMHTNGGLPFEIKVYWTLTWLWQVIATLADKL